MDSEGSSAGVSRRGFIRGLAAASLAGGLATSSAHAVPEARSPFIKPGPTGASIRRRPRAWGVVFLVVDGMSHGVLGLGEAYLKSRNAPGLNWLQLYRQPPFPLARGLQETWSANSVVTDSAAAASAWGGGRRVPNLAINIGADGRASEPLLVLAKRAGLATGLVSTARITHATPAAFAANVPDRGQEDAIAQQYLERGVDILLGGGSRHFDATSRADHADLFADFAAAGYTLCRSRDDLLTLPRQTPQLLGTFARSHLPYSVDRDHDPDLSRGVPTLSEMAAYALDNLSAREDGFVLQIEGARVDMAGHANDPAAILGEMLEFDRTLGHVVTFAKDHPEVLVIITTDHGTGGCQINGLGDAYLETSEALTRLGSFRASLEATFDALPAEPTADDVAAALQRASGGLTLSGDTADHLASLTRQVKADQAPESALATLLGQILAPHTSVGWTSPNHTGDPVEVCAFGPGSDDLAPYTRNFELHGLMRNALGI